jgi:hypothetical protein
MIGTRVAFRGAFGPHEGIVLEETEDSVRPVHLAAGHQREYNEVNVGQGRALDAMGGDVNS